MLPLRIALLILMAIAAGYGYVAKDKSAYGLAVILLVAAIFAGPGPDNDLGARSADD